MPISDQFSDFQSSLSGPVEGGFDVIPADGAYLGQITRGLMVSEVTRAPREIAEMSLSHRVGSDVERADARSDLLDKRRVLIERWSSFVAGLEGKGTNENH